MTVLWRYFWVNRFCDGVVYSAHAEVYCEGSSNSGDTTYTISSSALTEYIMMIHVVTRIPVVSFFTQGRETYAP